MDSEFYLLYFKRPSQNFMKADIAKQEVTNAPNDDKYKELLSKFEALKSEKEDLKKNYDVMCEKNKFL